ncbi:hypothetical protein O6H91_08G054300 [Diphasiastrum complanatum]|uniref:Uncharacterized protein n=1 Tax=Diphasiastrum complanatum TaxID=34168 RepID=A0ACC2CXS3_DIPCM|nr:hypothetical protein O6H91_08G054300 [Diphasiastrum complanatum]
MRSLHSGRGPAMAAPSSSPSPFSSSSCLRLDPGHGADACTGLATPCAFQGSNFDDAPLSMALDRDGFLRPAEHVQTLREHDAALSLLEKLDEFWFFDSVIKWPRNSGGSSSSCSGGLWRSCEGLASLPPFRSIELVHPERVCADVRKSGLQEFPRARFEKPPLCCAAESLTREDTVLNPSDEGGKIYPESSGSPRELSTTKNEISCIVSRAVEEDEPLLKETKSEEAATRELKHADEKLEANTSAKDQWDTATLTPSKAEMAEPMRKIPIPLVPSSTNVHLSGRPRRRRHRKHNSKGTDHIEYDEMKGFRELGFSFSQDKLTPRVISLFPGMKVDYAEGKNYSKVSFVASTQYKLYTSPTWWTTKPNSPLYNWQFPDPHQEGVDMKAHLKFWARAVASTVRQEC